MGTLVERVQTKVSEGEMAQAIVNAWRTLFGSEPYKEQVALIMAQNSLETANREKMWNYNVGNITTDGKGEYDYFEAIDKYTTGPQANKPFKFRAYRTLQDGIVDYLKFLSTRSNFSQAWQHILNPDPVSYSKALREANYYTGSEAAYTKSLKSLFDTFKKSKSISPTSKPPTTPSTMPPAKTQDLLTMEDNELESSLEDSVPGQSDDELNKFMDRYLKASFQVNKKDYFKYLTNNIITIKVASYDTVNSIEFSTILCNALDEELLSKSFVHTKDNEVEIECNIPGPKYACINAVNEVCNVVAKNFALATKKIGSVKVSTNLVIGKKSSLPPIKLSSADSNHRKFLLKLV